MLLCFTSIEFIYTQDNYEAFNVFLNDFDDISGYETQQEPKRIRRDFSQADYWSLDNPWTSCLPRSETIAQANFWNIKTLEA